MFYTPLPEMVDYRFIHVYRQLQIMGTQPVSVIARRLGVKRTTMYYVLERLADLGVVRQSASGRVRYYAPARLQDVTAALRRQRKAHLRKEKEFVKMCQGLTGKKKD